jgi:thiamine biosynthesis lipoprotein
MACEFSVALPPGLRDGVAAGCAALDEIERLEEKLSVYRAASDVSHINRAAAREPVAVDEEVFQVLELAGRIHRATGGAFDFAAGTLIRAWGFYRGPKRVPEEAERLKALEASGADAVLLDAGARRIRFARKVEINPGGIGKGYAIDAAMARIRREFGIGNVLMQGGRSSVRALGGWPVAIGDPFRPGRRLATVRLQDRALGTSGAAHQFFVAGGRRYGHILDPRTGWPADALASASALAPTAAEADALSTAFFVGGCDLARRYCREHPDIGAVLVTKPAADRPPRVVVLGLRESEFEVLTHEQCNQGVPGAAPGRNRVALPL